MPYTTIISTEELAENLDNPQWAVIDCRFSLQNTEQGRRDYAEAHIPGAVYAHLDEDLSGPLESGKTSRHPLPEVDTFQATLSTWGIDDDTQVVVYDDWGGAIAARAWWMMRWLGHENVAVLNGGWPAWTSEERPTRSGSESRNRATFVARPRPELLADAEEVARNIESGEFMLVDARTPDRYYGIGENLDPISGHIPGAVNHFYGQNLHEGRFLPPHELKRIYGPLIWGSALATSRLLLWLRRHRHTQRPGPALCRHRRGSRLPWIVERMDHQSRPPGGNEERVNSSASRFRLASRFTVTING